MPERARGKVEVDQQECKGCGLCVESCPQQQLELSAELNHYGVHPVEFMGANCSGCAICYFVCPEPGALTVYQLATAGCEARNEATV